MALAPIDTETHWADEIRDIAIEEFDAEITIRKPGKPGEYDPVTGTYGDEEEGELLIDSRIGRAQNLRSPLDYNDGNGWQTKLDYRIQFDMREDDPSITKGMVVTVSGGRDPELEKMTFHVGFATNSTHMAVRTVMCSTEGGRNG